MVKDPNDLVPQLCTRAAMIMEDVLEHALTVKSEPNPHRSRRLADLKQAADRIVTLLDAALALDAD